MYKLSVRTLSSVFLQLFLLGIENIVLYTVESQGMQVWCAVGSVCIVTNILVQVTGLIKEGQLFSLGGILILFSYLIHCSYCLLMGLDAFEEGHAIYLVFLKKHGGSSNFMAAIQYAMNGIAFLYIGYKLASNRRYKKNELGEKKEPDLTLLKRYGLLLSFIFGAIYMLSTILTIIQVLKNGSYENLQNVTGSFFMSLGLNLQAFFFEGLYLLMLYYKKTNRMNATRAILAIAVISLLLSFFTGARSRAIMILLVLLVFWMNDIGTFKTKYFMLYLVAGIVMLQLLVAIRVSRRSGFSVASVAENFFDFKNNVFYETLSEFGASIFVTAGFMNGYEVGHPLDFVVKEIGSVLPKVASWGGEIFQPSTVRTGFEERYHLGVTYIADFYYYFGMWGQYLLALFGVWIAFLDNKIKQWRGQKRYFALAVSIPGIVLVFNSVRASATLGLKMFLYSYIIFVLFRTMLNRGKIKRI